MRHWRCWWGHCWCGPTPTIINTKAFMWRGCMKCGKQQRQAVDGHWRDWNGHSEG